MPDKRYQVFVSSTFHDLEVERQEVMHALLELDCMPSGMELFPAANETQWNLIKKVIDDCDYYVLIIAGRYGSLGPEGYSYTEMEYRYALESGKPVISFLHKNPGKIVADKTEQSPDGREKLANFRSFVEKKLCKHWESPAELGSVVSRSLIQLIKSNPGIGWVRANELPDKDATLELLRLRRNVEELQNELARSRTTAPKGAEDLAQGDESHSFNCTLSTTPPDDYNHKYWALQMTVTWNEVFSAVAPLMIHEAADTKLKEALDEIAKGKLLPEVRKMKDVTGHRLRSITLNEDDFQTVKIQLRAVGLVAKSEKNRSVKDSGTYWTLTPYGDEIMTRLRAIRRIGFEPRAEHSGESARAG